MNSFNLLITKFQGLSARERVLTAFTAMVVLYFLIHVALLAPQSARRDALKARIVQQGVELNALKSVIEKLTAGGRVGLLTKDIAERDQLRRQVEAGNAVLSQAVGESRHAEVIRAMAAGSPGVTLVSLKTLGVEPLFRQAPMPARAASASASTMQVQPMALYKQGIEVTVKGNYLALLPYLQKLEQNQGRMFWANALLDVGVYPDATLRFTVYTLSPRADAPLS